MSSITIVRLESEIMAEGDDDEKEGKIQVSTRLISWEEELGVGVVNGGPESEAKHEDCDDFACKHNRRQEKQLLPFPTSG